MWYELFFVTDAGNRLHVASRETYEDAWAARDETGADNSGGSFGVVTHHGQMPDSDGGWIGPSYSAGKSAWQLANTRTFVIETSPGSWAISRDGQVLPGSFASVEEAQRAAVAGN